MNDIVLGIDIGATNTKYGFVSLKGEMIFENSIATSKNKNVGFFINEIYDIIHPELKKHDYHLKGIGIGAPNGNYYSGSIEFAPNLKWKGVVPLVSLFEKKFSVPAVLTNDANAAAEGELLYGNGKGMDHFIMITLGTGLGSGIIVNGKLVYGHDGFAGELGHTVTIPDGRKCGCGKRGCLETYVSAPGIIKTIFELLASETDKSELRNFSYNTLDAKMISDAALKGDPIALKAFDFTGKLLGMKLADAVMHTSPEAIFLFGGLAAAGKLIFDPAKKYMEEFLLPVFRNKVNIMPSALQDKNIAVLGAAALMWSELEEK
jgi:glucokinase